MIVRLICAWALCLALPASARGAEDVIPDLKKVRGIEDFDGPDSARALLKRNGFVAVPRFRHRIFSPYVHSRLPHYVTADSVHRTFHVIFEEELKRVETAFAGDLAGLTAAMAADLDRRSRAKDLAPQEVTDARASVEFFLVARALLDEQEAERLRAAPVQPADRVAAEMRLILAAQGPAPSPLFGYAIDYSQFEPRGFYTETPVLRRYFRAMSWYGNAAFRLESDRETRMAAGIAGALAGNKEAADIWRRMDRLYSHFVAPQDDLTPLEYAGVVAELPAQSAPEDFLAAFRKKAAGLRDPKINSMVLTPAEMPNWVGRVKGMRFLGKRYIPDSEVFMELTDPRVAGRGFPTGLDLMAANGSARARRMAEATPDAKLPGYAEGAARSAGRLAELKRAEAPSHYVEFLKLAETLTAPADARAPAFARTEAYADKNLTAALAAWASMRHTWQLHAKQSMICAGMGEEQEILPGYVEPNPAFFAQTRKLIRRTVEILKPVKGVQVERLEKLDELVGKLGAMVDKELAGKPFSAEEKGLLHGYGETIGELQGFDFNEDADSSYPWMALAADVHSEMLTGQCLQVATGGAMPIYVAVEHKGQWQLLVGGVYSYYELRRPVAERLSDEEWRRVWDNGRVPPLPGWTASYVAGFDAKALIARVRKGEMAGDLRNVNDPEIDAYLWKALSAGGELEGKDNYNWALRMATGKLGRKMVPRLLEVLREGEVGRQVEAKQGDNTVSYYRFGPAHGAASALAMVAGETEVPALTVLALGPDGGRAGLAVDVAGAMREKCAEGLLLAVARKSRAPALRESALRYLGWRASKDVTGELIALWPQLDAELRRGLIEALATIWCDEYGMRPANSSLPSRASEAELAKWARELKALVVRVVGEGATPYRDEAVKLAGLLKIAEAVPAIDRTTSAKDLDFSASEALGRIGTDEAVQVLLKLSRADDPSGRGRVLEALKEAPARRAVPRLRELLDDRGEVIYNDYRVCDRAADALAAILPDGPGFDIHAKVAERDAKIAKWREYLKKAAPESK
jgi:hypothetical protein